MATTKYSHAFLVGSFNGNVTPELLADDSLWEREEIKQSPTKEEKRYSDDKGYSGLCTIYYKAHLDAMIETQGVIRPASLSGTCHFVHNFGKSLATKVTLRKDQGKTPFQYTFYLQKLHLYFFPLEVVLFAIEIDDSNTDLNELTAAHYALINFLDIDAFDSQELAKKLAPLTKYIPKSNSPKLNKDGNKLKIFQTVEIIDPPNSEDSFNAVLYEIGTSAPIGSVLGGSCPSLKPSKAYFESIIKENIVSTFDNWKGLALMDSFTVLGSEDSFKRDDWKFMYFPLVYLRCLYEKTYYFSRNNAYRLHDEEVGEELSKEIAFMEKYYFYDNISYNFQPNLIYAAIAKGLEIKAERSDLIRQIKEKAKKEEENKKDKEEKRFNNILAYVSIFAVFSVIWDAYSIAKEAFTIPLYYQANVSSLFIASGVFIICMLIYQIYRKEINLWVQKNILKKK